MPPITSAPSPHRFAQAWSRRFDEGEPRGDAEGGATQREDAPKAAYAFADTALATLQADGDRRLRSQRLIDGGARAALARAAQAEDG